MGWELYLNNLNIDNKKFPSCPKDCESFTKNYFITINYYYINGKQFGLIVEINIFF